MTTQATKQTQECAAVLLGAIWECERCALSWQDGDKAPSCSPLTYARLIARAEGEADRIRQSLDAVAEAWPPGHKLHQPFRNQGQLTARMEFLALARLVESRRDADKGKAAT